MCFRVLIEANQNIAVEHCIQLALRRFRAEQVELAKPRDLAHLIADPPARRPLTATWRAY